MSAPISAEVLDEIEQRAKQAAHYATVTGIGLQDGPWVVAQVEGMGPTQYIFQSGRTNYCPVAEHVNGHGTAEFIAKSRTEWPQLGLDALELIAHIRAQAAEIERLRQFEPCPQGCERGWHRVSLPSRPNEIIACKCSTCDGTGTRVGADAVKAKREGKA